jgi:hypothetical protein
MNTKEKQENKIIVHLVVDYHPHYGCKRPMVYFLVNEVANVGQDAITQLYPQQLRANQLP